MGNRPSAEEASLEIADELRMQAEDVRMDIEEKCKEMEDLRRRISSCDANADSPEMIQAAVQLMHLEQWINSRRERESRLFITAMEIQSGVEEFSDGEKRQAAEYLLENMHRSAVLHSVNRPKGARNVDVIAKSLANVNAPSMKHVEEQTRDAKNLIASLRMNTQQAQTSTSVASSAPNHTTRVSDLLKTLEPPPV